MPDLLHDTERILRDCFRSFSRYPDATLIDEERAFGVITHFPFPFFSGIASTNMRDASDVAEMHARYRSRGAGMRWWLTPSARPENLETLLIENGFRHIYDARGMVAELETADLDEPLPEGLTIRRVTNAGEFEPWLEAVVRGFQRPESDRDLLRDAYGFFGFDEDAEWVHFVGFVDGEPVSTANILMAGDLVGVFFVVTLPHARGRGIGRAVTLAGMRFGHERGAQRAVLQSSDMGFNVYRSLGFVDVCHMRLYDWRPEYDAT